MKRILLLLAVVLGLGAPVQAQTELPVQVLCVKGRALYRPICNHVKQAVNRNSEFKQARSGNRYVVILTALNLQNEVVIMSVAIGATLSDPLSHLFPYHIVNVPFPFLPSQSASAAELVVDTLLPIAVEAFSSVVDEINSYGPSGRELSEGDIEDMLEEMKLEMDRFLKEPTN